MQRRRATAIIAGLALLVALALPAGAGAVEVTIDSETADLTNTDPTQDGRITFTGSASTCGSDKTPPNLLDSTARSYDAYSSYTDLPSAPYTNLTNETICITVTLIAGGGSPTCAENVFAATFAPSFAPGTPAGNYLADAAAAPPTGMTGVSYGFEREPGEGFVNVVAAVDSTDLCEGYVYLLKANKPFAKTAPTTTGTPAVGSGLGFTTGTWAGTPSFSYQWRRCDTSGANCADIPSATSGAYLVTAADAGSTLRLRVTASDGIDTSSADTAATSVVPAPPATTSPTGTGGGGKAKAKCKKKKKSSASAAKKKKCKKKKR